MRYINNLPPKVGKTARVIFQWVTLRSDNFFSLPDPRVLDLNTLGLLGAPCVALRATLQVVVAPRRRYPRRPDRAAGDPGRDAMGLLRRPFLAVDVRLHPDAGIRWALRIRGRQLRQKRLHLGRAVDDGIAFEKMQFKHVDEQVHFGGRVGAVSL